MGTMSARWWSGLVLAGLVLPGCCSTCGNKPAWGGTSGTASNNRIPPSYPGSPSGMAGNSMNPPSNPNMQQVQPAGFTQPRGMTTQQQPSANFQPSMPSGPMPNTPPSDPMGYNKPIGGSRQYVAPQGGGSPLDMPAPPGNSAGMLPPSNMTPAGGMEAPPVTPPSMPPSNTMPAGGSGEPPIVPPGPPGPPTAPGQ